uniref:Cytochrome c biogenesis protein CcsA n=1 Tax=Cressa cretica TaxID=1465651 RepID=A0A220NCZ5_9ASTE|nr:cytochrome c biogenesis protein [Cressa cretica]ASJ65105.1 cytochrome c biogenesis protein [Cressa cretica]
MHILTHISFSVVSIVITIFLTLLVDEMIELYDSSDNGMIVACFCITGLLATRWISARHFPLSDLYESFIFLSWSFALIYNIPYFAKNTKFLSIITNPSAIFIQGFATSGFLTEKNQSLILVPALKSEWLIMHVSMMILSYAALLCGSLVSVALLVITFRKKEKLFFEKKKSFFPEKKNNFLNESLFFNISQKASAFSAKNYYKIQFIQQLDYWSYRIISLGFLFLTIGILSGAVWANEAWGSYWSWDPKETWAFITWIVFAIYLHARTNKKFAEKNLQSTNSAIVASIGFLIIWICYFGVNLVGISLHSYGSFPSKYS